MASPARAAVRPAAGGAGRADRHRPGAGRQGRRVRARRDRQAGRQGRGSTRTRRPSSSGLVTGSLTKDVFADADLVIEAVFEEMSVKQQVFAEVEEIVAPECVLATNTSSLSVTEMAADAGAPGAGRRPALLQPGRGAAAAGGRPRRADRRRDAGHRVRGRQGAEEVLRAGQGRPGVRREPAAHPVPRRGHRADRRRARRSTSPTAALDPLGLPMTPFALLQLVGPAVALHVAETLHAAFPDRFAVSREPGAAWSRRASRRLRWPGRRRRPRGRRAARRRRDAADRRRGARRAPRGAGAGDPADARRGRRRRGRRTSTCACSSAPAGRSTWAASRRTWTAPASPRR